MTLCVMNYCFTISELIMVQWEEMKDAGFVPQTAKGVEHEVRTVFSCALNIIDYLMGIAIIYAGCLR